ncbi:protein containing radical SAM domain [Sulfurimonas gotlandica GD1]|uniref:Protein containing radical SAM domain n=2 Tax=Sulfurimonas TaxID=202746 RepID=B6BIZ5_SULGG|nr:Fe-S oxidoreductase [Sulfurimonas gotlandica GD1]EHP30508.1 protein containing radical SAM domain [Sulfurimonas gotlandica GD1]
MYKTKSFEVRIIEDVFRDVDTLAHSYPDARKVFLADGDALSLETEYLIRLLKYLKQSFSKLGRVSLYASAQNILNKSSQELEMLKENGLSLIYYGVETGSETVLKKITKGVNQSEIIESLNKASDAGIKISATVILGIGGTKYTDEHISESAKVINATRVNYLSTLQLGLEDDSKEKFYKHFSDFEMLDDTELLQEQKKFLQLLNPTNKIIFRSNHASNALHLAGNLPREKGRLIEELDNALSIGKMAFVPMIFRGF